MDATILIIYDGVTEGTQNVLEKRMVSFTERINIYYLIEIKLL